MGSAVRCSCPVHPSEDPREVARAVSYAMDGAEVPASPGGILFESPGLGCLGRVRTGMEARRRTFIRQLESNRDGDSTWFYLNKQAAWAGSIALCAEPDESPLGPIRVSVRSPDISGAILWLASTKTK